MLTIDNLNLHSIFVRNYMFKYGYEVKIVPVGKINEVAKCSNLEKR